MAGGSLDAALAPAIALLAEAQPDEQALIDAVRALSKAVPHDPSAAQLRDVFSICYAVLGIGPEGEAPIAHVSERGLQSLYWTALPLIENILTDPGGRNRGYVQRSLIHSTALGRDPYPGAPDKPVPRVHIPLEKAEAAALARPFFQHLESRMAKAPYDHLKFCWQAREYPQTPFDTIIDDWLDDIDTRGLGPGNSRHTLDRAYALASLAKEGRQHLSWPDCEQELLPQLRDPHPMVAGCAGRFLGMLYSDPADYFVFSEPKPIRWIMDHLATLPVNRRQAAGGFLDGMLDGSEPFAVLRKHPELEGFDLDGWTRAILSQADAEPYVPGAQAFWFFVHEGYCFDPVFVDSLIDMDRAWEAMMCATEMHQRVDGMQTVLERLAALGDGEVSDQAQAWLARHYGPQHGSESV